jgi:membrane associated rhomboid family serine protease
MSFMNDIRMYLKGTYRSVVIFLIINIAVFIVANILIHATNLGGSGEGAWFIVRSIMCIPGEFNEFLSHFWTLGTYMFFHLDVRHILGNMLWLYFLGRIFCDLLGSKRLMTVYLLGGLSGGVLFLMLAPFIPFGEQSYLFGASGSVMAIVAGVATHAPNYRIYPFGIAMKLKWLAVISFALTTVIDMSANTGGKVAHLGGGIFGILWALNMKNDWLTGMFKRKPKLNVVHKKKMSDAEFNQYRTGVRSRVDEILDKISRSGYDSLTREEKDFLQKNHDKF